MGSEACVCLFVISVAVACFHRLLLVLCVWLGASSLCERLAWCKQCVGGLVLHMALPRTAEDVES